MSERQEAAEASPVREAYQRALIARYTAQTQRSKDAARAYRPQVANLQFYAGFRADLKELHYPLVAQRSAGARFWDLDGNEYLDFCMGWGAHLFGFDPAFVREAVAGQLALGWHVGIQAEQAGEAAVRFCAVTGSERVFFSNTGTESVMTSLRLARAVVGRDKVVMFRRAYHGHADHFLLTGSAQEGEAVPAVPGVARGFAQDVFMLEFGAPSALDFVRARGAEIAAVLVDPIPAVEGAMSARDFLPALREVTSSVGAALVFDEVLTGMRMSARGAQGYYGVQADLAAYGKVLGGGLPMGAVGGKAQFLDAVDGGAWRYGDDSAPHLRPTIAMGTFCRHPLAMAAAVAVLREIEARGQSLYDELNGRAAALAERLTRVLAGRPVNVEVAGSMLTIEPQLEDVTPLVHWAMALRGIHMPRGDCFISAAHTDDDCERFAGALREVVDELLPLV